MELALTVLIWAGAIILGAIALVILIKVAIVLLALLIAGGALVFGFLVGCVEAVKSKLRRRRRR